MDLTLKNLSFFSEINITFAAFIDFSTQNQLFPLRLPLGRSWAAWHHITSDYVQIASRLPPDCFQITSRLPPDYFRLLPDYFQIASRLPPDYFQITSIYYFQIAYRLLPDYFQITSRLLL